MERFHLYKIDKMYFASGKEMEKIDRIAVEQGLEIRQMMELAGWHILAFFEKLKIQKSRKVVVVCGKGNKGGDGLTAARHLSNHGYAVSVVLVSRDVKRDAKHQLQLLKKMQLPIFLYPNLQAKKEITKANVLIDALIGYHLGGKPRGVFQKVIEEMNRAKAKIISYDIPSGVDATSGVCLVPCIQAVATLTLALPKRGLKKARKYFGKTVVADIGIPAFVYDRVKKGSRPPFDKFFQRFITVQ